jgi:predicted MPP superfamily phosphohydrolase
MNLAGFFFFAGASVGHIAILVYSLNWWYGLALPHRLLSSIKVLHGILVGVGVAGFAYVWIFVPSLQVWFNAEMPVSLAASAYSAACTFIGWIVVPIITLRRNLTGKPALLASNHTQTLDLARELGYKPAGTGKYRLLAKLPGNEIFKVDFSERMLYLPRLPAALEGLTILHLSDLHFCGTPGRAFYQRVMRRCRDWDPDIVAITGDFVDSLYYHRWILPIVGWLRWRVAGLAVLGNHDGWHRPEQISRRLERLGIQLLHNSWKELRVRGESLITMGHEGPWSCPGPDLSNCPSGPFRLCLSHTPDNFPWARKNQIDLMLAGHVHGGQIRFPVVGSVLVPSIYSRRYDCGVFHESPTVLHVSRGLAGQEPLRYGCKPEVVKLVLRTSS